MAAVSLGHDPGTAGPQGAGGESGGGQPLRSQDKRRKSADDLRMVLWGQFNLLAIPLSVERWLSQITMSDSSGSFIGVNLRQASD